MSSIRKGSTMRSDDTMDDDSDDKDSKRKSRNLSEKKRRDQFNLLVNELNSMVATGSRKMDKSTVLKSTISFLKNHNEVAVRSRANEIQEHWKPTFLSNEEFTHLILEAIDGFIAVFSVSGRMFYTSESITSLLGHLPSEVVNMSIYDIASEDEHNNLYNVLMSPSEEETQVSFSCHLRRGGCDRKQTDHFELVHFVGYFRSDEDMVDGETRYSGYSGEADTRLVFVGTGRLQTPQLIREMPLVDDTSRSEFSSRHSLEWKFLFLDHRAPPIIGYLPFELLGTSGYDYYHVDDLDNVVNCHDALMQKGEGTSCFYRFLTKGQQWIWLQTRYYITYHQWNSKPEFIVCTHRVISYADVMKQSRKGDKEEVPWPEKRSVRDGPASVCTTMSADSPMSRQSIITQPSTKCKSEQNHAEPAPLPPQQYTPPEVPNTFHQQQFLEPSAQYLAAIPMQPMIPAFPPTAVLPSLQSLDNVIMSPNHSQIQMDLQRKHAELQAIIGQQQAELMRVSEQLLMARLGILPQTQNPPLPDGSTYQSNSSGAVSSTTATIQGMVESPSLAVSVSMSMELNQNPSHLYHTQNSNEHHK